MAWRAKVPAPCLIAKFQCLSATILASAASDSDNTLGAQALDTLQARAWKPQCSDADQTMSRSR